MENQKWIDAPGTSAEVGSPGREAGHQDGKGIQKRNMYGGKGGNNGIKVWGGPLNSLRLPPTGKTSSAAGELLLYCRERQSAAGKWEYV